MRQAGTSLGSSVPEVALLVETSKEYGRELVKGIHAYEARHGPWLVNAVVRGYEDPEPAWLGAMWNGAGIITRSRSIRRCLQAHERGIPVVDLRYYQDRRRTPFPRIDTSQEQIVSLAVRHLGQRGFTHLGFVGITGVRWSRDRESAFRTEVSGRGHEAHTVRVLLPEQNRDIAAWIRELPRPVGLLCANDEVGLHVLRICKQLELAIPGEVGVLGIDNDELLCEVANPKLSSIDQGAYRVGFEAAKLLDKMMRGGEVPADSLQLLDPIGVVTRSSTREGAIENRTLAVAIQFMESVGWSGITVDEVARTAHCSRRTLERLFQRHYDCTVFDMLNRNRLQHLKRLLLQSDASIQSLAEPLGFSNGSALSRYFKQQEGMSPSEFRTMSLAD